MARFKFTVCNSHKTILHAILIFSLQEQLAQSLFDHIPVGVGSKGIIPMNARDLEEALEMGMDWSLREGNFCH